MAIRPLRRHSQAVLVSSAVVTRLRYLRVAVASAVAIRRVGTVDRAGVAVLRNQAAGQEIGAVVIPLRAEPETGAVTRREDSAIVIATATVGVTAIEIATAGVIAVDSAAASGTETATIAGRA